MVAANDTVSPTYTGELGYWTAGVDRAGFIVSEFDRRTVLLPYA